MFADTRSAPPCEGAAGTGGTDLVPALRQKGEQGRERQQPLCLAEKHL